jgi:hypothetical protein
MSLPLKVFSWVVMLAGWTAQAQAQMSLADQKALAMRFRPYIKTSVDGSPEKYRPANWDWFVERSRMVQNYQPQDGGAGCAGIGTADPQNDGQPLSPAPDLQNHPEALIQPPGANLAQFAISGGAVPDYRYALHLLNGDQYYGGEPWDDVIKSGHGLYAHVEQVSDVKGPLDIFNIEYTIVWAYNNGYCSHHDADITTIVVLYDRAADMLTRITYSMHGNVLQAYRLASPTSIDLGGVSGTDQNGVETTASSAKLHISAADAYGISTATAAAVTYAASDSYVYMVRDGTSLRWEHPVIFAEAGSHEPWPNDSGRIFTASTHNGSSVSFLPGDVQILGTPAAPNPDFAPFIRYNGKFGTDPVTLVMHNAWYWPGVEGRLHNYFNIPPGRFDELDPYDPKGKLGWPPAPEFVPRPADTVYVVRLLEVSDTSGLGLTGTTAHPYPDPFTANSFAPPGATVMVGAGTYLDNGTLSRPARFVAQNGLVIIGAK